MEPDYFHLKDNDESTCESTEAFRLSWLLNHDLTWIRIVYMNEADANITLKFYYGQKSVSYTSMFYNFYDSFIDIYLRMENLTNSVQFLFGKRTSICDVRISGGRNMALKQTTWQIDTSTIGEYNSNNAVDGNRDPNVQSGSCSRTLTTKGHVFWNLVFNSAVDVYRFLIVNAATRREQLSNFCLTVYDKKTRKVNIRDESSQRGEFAYNVTVPTTRATKVTISINNNYQLVLCEVEIFGDKACPNNYFGLDCEKTCNCGQDEDWCMSATGACSKGCRTGYKGVDCNEGIKCKNPQPIPNGEWKRCDFNYKGECVLTCKPGYRHVGNTSIRCDENKKWTIPGKCLKINMFTEDWYGPNHQFRDLMLQANYTHPDVLLKNRVCFFNNSILVAFLTEIYQFSVTIILMYTVPDLKATFYYTTLSTAEQECLHPKSYWSSEIKFVIECHTNEFIIEFRIMLSKFAPICRVRVNGGRNVLKESRVSLFSKGKQLTTDEYKLALDGNISDYNSFYIEQQTTMQFTFLWPRIMKQLLLYTCDCMKRRYGVDCDLICSITCYDQDCRFNGVCKKCVQERTGDFCMDSIPHFSTNHTGDGYHDDPSPTPQRQRMHSLNLGEVIIISVLVLAVIITVFLSCYTDRYCLKNKNIGQSTYIDE